MLADGSEASCEILELNPHRLGQRQKQIDYGKNTPGYESYITKVPRYAQAHSDQLPCKYEKHREQPCSSSITPRPPQGCLKGRLCAENVDRRHTHRHPTSGRLSVSEALIIRYTAVCCIARLNMMEPLLSKPFGSGEEMAQTAAWLGPQGCSRTGECQCTPTHSCARQQKCKPDLQRLPTVCFEIRYSHLQDDLHIITLQMFAGRTQLTGQPGVQDSTEHATNT